MSNIAGIFKFICYLFSTCRVVRLTLIKNQPDDHEFEVGFQGGVSIDGADDVEQSKDIPFVKL